MNKSSNKRFLWFAVIVFLIAGAGIGYAAVPQSTIQTTAGGITTYVGHYGNFTESVESSEYFLSSMNITDNILNADPLGNATFNDLTLSGDLLNTYNVTQTLQYPQQSASYIIWRDGSTYYAKNGITGVIDYSGANAATVIQSSLDNGDKCFLTNGIYAVTSTITVNSNTTLTLSANTTIVPSGDINLFQIKPGATLTGGTVNAVNQTGRIISLSADRFRFRDKTLVSNMKLIGNTSAGNFGVFAYSASSSFPIIGVTFRDISIEGFEYGIQLRIDDDGYVNANTFDNIYGRHTVYFIYLRDLDNNNDADIDGNYFKLQYQYGGATSQRGLRIIGRYNVFEYMIWDWAGADMVDLLSDSNNNILISANNWDSTRNTDDGTLNKIISQSINKRGNATLASDSSSIVVNHGCGYTPVTGEIQVTPNRHLGNCTVFWFDTITATQFTIHVGDAGAEKKTDSTIYFLWSVVRR